MRHRIRIASLLTVTTIACTLAEQAVAASSFAHQATVQVLNTPTAGGIDISVMDGSAGYAGLGGTVTGAFGDGTVLDYRFVNDNDRDGFAALDAGYIGIIGVGQAHITEPPPPTNYIDLWTQTGPAGFTTTPDFAAVASSRDRSVPGLIDITGLTTGTIYFITGTDQNVTSMSASMGVSNPTGAIPEIHAQTQTPTLTGEAMWVHSFTFENPDGLYDSITYLYSNTHTDGTRSRFTGIVLDAVPEPGSLALLGLGGLCLLRRRRDG